MLPVFFLPFRSFHFDKLFTTPLAICHYTWYVSQSVEEQIFIPIFFAIGDYKNIELVWNTNSITVEFSKSAVS